MQLAEWMEKQKDLTQERLARRVGVTQGRIAQILHGGLPSMRLAARIQDVTKNAVTPNDFVGKPRRKSS